MITAGIVIIIAMALFVAVAKIGSRWLDHMQRPLSPNEFRTFPGRRK